MHITMNFVAKIFLYGSHYEDHYIKIQRILGKFTVPKEVFEKKDRAGVGSDELRLCLHQYKINIIINHYFDLSHFKEA